MLLGVLAVNLAVWNVLREVGWSLGAPCFVREFVEFVPFYPISLQVESWYKYSQFFEFVQSIFQLGVTESITVRLLSVEVLSSRTENVLFPTLILSLSLKPLFYKKFGSAEIKC